MLFQNLKNRNLPNGKAHNRNLEAYAKATENAAKESGVQYVDLFNPTRQLFEQNKNPLTINGAHLNEEGNRLLAEVIAQALLGKDIPATDSLLQIKDAIHKKIGLGIIDIGQQMEMIFGGGGQDFVL